MKGKADRSDISAVEVVQSFFDAWNRMAFEEIIQTLSTDIYYHNIPMTPLRGISAVRDYLQGAWRFEAVDWQILHIAATGNVVLTERIDNFVINGSQVSLPLMGSFEVVDGKITVWRDYFDLQSYRDQLAAATNPHQDADTP